MAEYGLHTYNCPNPLRRFSHNSRFAIAAEFVYGNVLDYGCGDGHFLRLVKPKASSVMGYDPWDGANPEGVPFVRDVNTLKTTFDCIVCLEVLEHIPDDLVDRFLAELAETLET